jgi:hypothetical protein
MTNSTVFEFAVLTTIVYPSLQKETCILSAKDERGVSNYLTQFLGAINKNV